MLLNDDYRCFGLWIWWSLKHGLGVLERNWVIVWIRGELWKRMGITTACVALECHIPYA